MSSMSLLWVLCVEMDLDPRALYEQVCLQSAVSMILDALFSHTEDCVGS